MVGYAQSSKNGQSAGQKNHGDLDRLSTAMRRGRRVLEYFRRERRRAVAEYVGRHWSGSGSERIVPVNLISRFVQVVSRSLIAKNPRVLLSTSKREMKPAVDAMQTWINNHFEESYFHETLARFVTDAIFAIGIMKVAVASPADSLEGDYETEVGEPFAETIDLDDFVFDVSASRLKDVEFAGHRFRIPFSEAKRMNFFSRSARAKLRPDSEENYNQEGDERIGVLGRGYEGDSSEVYREAVTVWEVYVPHLKKVLYLPGDGAGVPSGTEKPLKVVDWFGPSCGPYHYLGYGIVPGNPMPLAPVQNLIDMHRLVNRLWRKTGDQAERQKTLLLASGVQVDDAGRIKEHSDGGICPVDNPDNAKEVSFGGPNPAIVQFQAMAEMMFNKLANNLDILSGAAPQSKTATQDQLLNANAQAGMADMQEATVAAVARVVKALLELWWYHPQKVMPSTRSIPGLPDAEIRRELHPWDSGKNLSRKGSFSDLAVRIDPYSMQYRSPQQRLGFLMQLVEKHLPVLPLAAQAGVQFDWQAYFKMIADLSDEPRVADLFTVGEPPAPPQGQGQGDPMAQAGRMPSATTRTYERRSVGANSPASQEAEAANEFSRLAAADSGGQ